MKSARRLLAKSTRRGSNQTWQGYAMRMLLLRSAMRRMRARAMRKAR